MKTIFLIQKGNRKFAVTDTTVKNNIVKEAIVASLNYKYCSIEKNEDAIFVTSSFYENGETEVLFSCKPINLFEEGEDALGRKIIETEDE